MIRTLFTLAFGLLLAGCNSSPGPLEGTWRATGGMPLTTTFRAGQMETMGVIEKVSYKVDDQSVIVTMNDGFAKGSSIRYVVVRPDTIQAMGLTYRKVSN
jgi:hypothetical protein